MSGGIVIWDYGCAPFDPGSAPSRCDLHAIRTEVGDCLGDCSRKGNEGIVEGVPKGSEGVAGRHLAPGLKKKGEVILECFMGGGDFKGLDQDGSEALGGGCF